MEVCVSLVLCIMATDTMKPHLLYIRKETQKPAACVLVMCALVLSVFLMGVMLKGLAASAAKHAAQTACISLSLSLSTCFLFWLSDTVTLFHGQTYGHTLYV